jgi:hypothetical protein
MTIEREVLSIIMCIVHLTCKQKKKKKRRWKLNNTFQNTSCILISSVFE